MEYPIYTVDAFTDMPFKGNPAAVCILSKPCEAEWMLRVAAEMNLAETAFLVPQADGYGLRWFTPAVEVPLCGHATLASAHVLWETGRLSSDQAACFQTLSGTLTARRTGEMIELNFPALPTQPMELPLAARNALNHTPQNVVAVLDASSTPRNFLVEFASEAEVRACQPDFYQLRQLPYGIIVTARANRDDPANDFDFVSRYFASAFGIDEDPVTGSAHCALTPYWAGRLNQTVMKAWQASARGGALQVELQGDRVLLRGKAVTILRGNFLA